MNYIIPKLKVSEIFYSYQGEGLYHGTPSIFLRVFGCNFTCSGFNMPSGLSSTERLDIDPDRFKKYEELPLVHTGCDSYSSWDVRFKHMSPMMSITQVVDRFEELLPNKKFNEIHLVITGGEPLLPRWQKSYVDLFKEIKDRKMNLKYVTFETNGTQRPEQILIDYIKNKRNIEFTISCSVKLSCSGEDVKDRIKIEAIRAWEDLFWVDNMYYKFVVNRKNDFDEIVDIVKAVDIEIPVYVMPVGGTTESYEINEKWVAKEALKRGYRFSPRLHIKLYGNSWGNLIFQLI